MANWHLPTAASGYLNFVTEMNEKFIDAISLQSGINGVPTNIPYSAIRYNRPLNMFQEWVGDAWQNKILSIAGGGTGASTAGDIRINLGLGSMSTQNNNAVNITGGSITGVTFDVTSATGILPLARGGTGSSLSLGFAGTVLMSAGGTVNFYSGGNIAELNASSLIAGTVPDARLSGNVAKTNVPTTFTSDVSFQGYTTFHSSGPTSLTIVNPSPTLNFYNTSAGPDSHYVRMIHTGGQILIQALNDAYTTATNWLTISPFGIVASSFYGDGRSIENLDGSKITLGIVNPSRLGTGSPSSATYLRGDGVWATVATGGEVSPIPSGMIAIFDSVCPAGWTRFTQLDNRFPLGQASAGATGGASTHSHSFDVTSGNAGDHSHSFGGSFGGSGSGPINGGGTTAGPSLGTSTADSGNSFDASVGNHVHNFSISGSANVDVTTNINGSTSGVGGHAHRVAGGTDAGNNNPPYYGVVFCRKN